MSFIADYGLVLLVLACLFGFFMAWGVGANDVANAMGTSVGSRALTIKQAILIAMVFEFCGAYLAGGEVTETIKSGIVDASMITPDLMVLGMMSALLAAGTWLLIASIKGWPVSTTHSIVGAVIGFAAVGVSVDAVNWGGVGPIVASWVVSPMLSGTIAFGLFISVQRLIIDTDDPFRNAKRFVPLYMFVTGFMISLMTVTKGLKHVGLNLSGGEGLLLALAIGALVMLLVLPWLDTSKVRSGSFRPMFKWFYWLFAINFVALTYLGAQPAEGIYTVLAKVCTAYYFIYFLVVLPVLSRIETPKPLPTSISESVLGKAHA